MEENAAFECQCLTMHDVRNRNNGDERMTWLLHPQTLQVQSKSASERIRRHAHITKYAAGCIVSAKNVHHDWKRSATGWKIYARSSASICKKCRRTRRRLTPKNIQEMFSIAVCRHSARWSVLDIHNSLDQPRISMVMLDQCCLNCARDIYACLKEN